MYEVFINGKPVTLAAEADDALLQHGVLMARTDCKKVLESVVDALIERPRIKGLVLLHEDVEELFRTFQSLFLPMPAAGGIVHNESGSILFIFRNGTWDLPKGKVEPGESVEEAAMREVEEECGIDKLSLGQKLPNTYHVFERKGKWYFKVTHWYEMTSSFTGKLVPQTAEGIEKVEWIAAADLGKVRQNTWPNILKLLG